MPTHTARMLIAILTILIAAPAPATDWVFQHAETFSTTDFLDADLTTADWDVNTGEVRLHPYAFEILGGIDPVGVVLDAVPYGRYAVQAAGSLHVVDLYDPDSPSIVGAASMNDAQGVAVAGRYAFVAVGSDGVKIVDLSLVTGPTVVASWGPSIGAVAVAAAGDRLFVADTDQLKILDISDPTAPTALPSYTRPALDVAVSGHVAYIAADNFDLLIVDVSDPTTAPVLIEQFLLEQPAVGIAVDGNRAYVAAGSAGLKIIDVTDPAAPVLLGSAPVGSFASDVAVDGYTAYVTDQGQGLSVFDCTHPDNPLLVRTVDEVGTASAVSTRGRLLLYSEASHGLKIVESHSILDEAIPGAGLGLPGDALDVVRSGDLAFAACGVEGLVIADVSLPHAPQHVATWDEDHDVRTVAIAGGRAYVACADAGLVILDITAPTTPVVLGTRAGNVRDVAIQGTVAYLAAVNEGFVTLDVGDPATITLLDSHSSIGAISVRLAVAGDRAVRLTTGSQGERTFGYDVSDPANIESVGVVNGFGGDPRDVAIFGSCVLVGASNGIQTLNFREDGALVSDQFVATPEIQRIAVFGDRLAACGPDGVELYDLSYPPLPTSLGRVGDAATCLDVADGILYLGTDPGQELVGLELYQDRYDLTRNLVQVTDLLDFWYPTIAIKVATGQSGPIAWEYESWASNSWYEIQPGDDYLAMSSPGNDPRWRGRLGYAGAGAQTTCDWVVTDWLYYFGPINTVEDIPDDQGGQVRVRWTRSGLDISDASNPVTQYAVYRRIEGGKNRPPADGRDTPPGNWDFVTAVPAATDDTYATVVPTLADSSISGGMRMTTFFVRALTALPSVYYNSPADSGYSVDNLAPNVPQDLVVTYGQPGGVALVWEESPDTDFRYFKVYRGDVPDFEPLPENLIQETVDPAWTDPGGTVGDHYRVSAVDFAGNESGAAIPDLAVGAPDESLPAAWALHPCAPNPFNPATTIRFDLPRDGAARVEIFDAAGRRVRSLLAGSLPAGRHEVTWRGRDDHGRIVGSGVYFCRLVGGDFAATRKMMLVQ